ncbi:MAG: response regulator [Agriterribacter sp.]
MDKKLIYVADDDASILELMELILTGKGYEVITSNDGRSLQTLTNKPDLVFLDIGMSDTDGSEICRSFKNKNHQESAPVILVSANDNLVEIAEDCGADDTLAKPFDVKAVVELAQRYTTKGNK